jgi:hypothetical protein
MKLTKKELTASKELIKTGYERESQKVLTETLLILKQWQDKKCTGSDTFDRLAMLFAESDKEFNMMYGQLSASEFIDAISDMYNRDILRDSDFTVFTPGVVEYLKVKKERWTEYNGVKRMRAV